jgi:hypothetical protein
MPRTLHDEFAKDWMQEFLSDFGTVQTEFQISSEVRHVDVYFEPHPGYEPAPIGTLGHIIATPCLVEPFRNAIPVPELCNCIAKSTIFGINLARIAKREKQRFRFEQRPFLWMITPTLSPRIQKICALQETRQWGPGIYFRPESDRAAVIVIHHLPVTHDTLWLRLFGRSKVQQQAIAELMALPQGHPYRSLTLRHIAVLQRNLKTRQNISNDLRQVIMALSITYEQIEAELLQRGEAIGEVRGEARGEARGKALGEASQQAAIAQTMLNEQFDIPTIARVTGLTIEQVEALGRSA